MESESIPALIPFVGLLLWRHNLNGRTVFVLDREGQSILPKGPLAEGEGEAQTARRLASAFGNARVSNLRHMHSDHPAVPGGRATLSWWSGECVALDPGARPAFEGQGRWVSLANASTLLTHPRERALIADLQPAAWLHSMQRLGRTWFGAFLQQASSPADRDIDHACRRIESSPLDPSVEPGKRWQDRALQQLDLARQALVGGDVSGYSQARAEAWRIELPSLKGWELEQAQDHLSRRIGLELNGEEQSRARDLLERSRAVDDLVHASVLLDEARRRSDLERGARQAQRRWLARLMIATLVGLWIGGSSDGPTQWTLLLHGLLGGTVSTLLWPSPLRDPAFPYSGQFLLRPVLGAVCALVIGQILSLGALGISLSSAHAQHLTAFIAGFGERVIRARLENSPN